MWISSKFEEKGLPCRIDHRSYERQGLDLLPTVHEGVAVRQMEAKGVTTDKGDFNRWVKLTNSLLRDLRKKVSALIDWIAMTKEKLSKPISPNLADLLNDFYTTRNGAAWSSKGKVGNLKYFSQAVNFLAKNQLFSLEDLDERIATHSEKLEAVKASMKDKSARKKELEELLRYAALYQELKPIYDELGGIKRKSQRERFRVEYKNDLKLFHMASRKLEKHRAPGGKIPIQAWQQELANIQQEYQAEYERYKPMRDDMAMLLRVKSCVDTVLRQ